MFTKAKAIIADYFQPIMPFLSTLGELYDTVLESVFHLIIFYGNQGKRYICIENDDTIIIGAWSIVLIIMTLLPLIYPALLLLTIPLWAFAIFTVVDFIAHHCHISNYDVFISNIELEEEKRMEISQFNEIFGFTPPDEDDEIYEVKIACGQKEVTAKLSILDNLRKESFSEQKLIREKIATFSQGEFAENPEKYMEEAKSLTEEKNRIDSITEKRKTVYARARNSALRFHYQAPDTKKLH